MYEAFLFGSFHEPHQRKAILYERRRALLVSYVNAWRLQCAVKDITSVRQEKVMTFIKGPIRMSTVRECRGRKNLAKFSRHL